MHMTVLANTKIHEQHTHAKDEAEHLRGTVLLGLRVGLSALRFFFFFVVVLGL